MIKKYIFDKLRNKEGAALITVLVIFLTLVVIVTSATAVAFANFQRSKKSADTSSVYYIAEAGLNQHYDELNNYFESNKDTVVFDDTFPTLFLESLGATDNYVTTDYGKVLNQDAFSKTTFKLLDMTIDSVSYVLESTGYIGSSSRKVSMNITINPKTSSGTHYQPDATVSINLDPNPIPVTIQTTNFKGPLITNSEVIIPNTSPKFTGPLVTNNNIISKGSFNLSEATLITSGMFSLETNSGGRNLKTAILKPNGSINIMENYTNYSISNLLLPITNTGDYSRYFKEKNNVSQTLYDKIIANGDGGKIKAIYLYNPVNFDPFTSDIIDLKTSNNITNAKRESIFGKPKETDSSVQFDYRDYFKSDFVLDNMEDKSITDKYLPRVIMPKKPDFNKYVPNNIDNYTRYINGTDGREIELVNASNEFTFNDAWYVPTLVDLTGFVLDNNTRSFNSIKFNGAGYASKPLQLYVGDKDIVLVTKKLDINNFIEIIGKGSLRIYVIGEDGLIGEDQLKMNILGISQKDSISGPVVNYPHRMQFVIYETINKNKSGPILFKTNNGGTVVSASFFTDNLNFQNFGKFSGTFISAHGTEINFENSGSLSDANLIFAPEATVNVKGGKFKGVIASKHLITANAGVQFEFDTNMDKTLVDELLPEFIIPGEIPSGSGGAGGSGSTLDSGPVIEVDE